MARCVPLRRLDRAGITASTVCALHCALVALLPVLPPTALGQRDQSWLETALLIVAVGVAAVAVLAAFFFVHRNGQPLIWAALGVVLLSARSAWFSSSALETPCSLLGAGCMIVAHACNSRLCQRSCCGG
jgi:hypothetical protein